jgi:hypothetical protein
MFKKILLIFLFISFLTGSFCFAQKELEIEYPTVPGVEAPTTTKTALPDYLRYMFTFAIIVAGLLAFVSLIYGGIRYLTSAGDPTKMADAQGQATAGILGLIILLASYLILNTINPQLVLPETPPLQPAVAGVYAYVKAGCVDEPDNAYDDRVLIDEDTPDLSERLPKDKDGIPQSLQCIEFRSGKEELTAKVCSGTDFGEPCALHEGEVGETENVTGKSIKLDYHPPGVYLYASSDCTGDDYKIYQSSSATLPEFDGETNSIKFIYGDKNPDTGEYGIKYAAILHEKEGYMGEAMLYDQDQGACKDLSETAYPSPVHNISVSSITVYLKPVGEPIGDGVRLYEHKNYEMHDDSSECEAKTPPPAFGDGASVPDINDYSPLKYCTDKCDASCEEEFSSMEMDGHYVALLFRHEDYSGDCEVFMSSCPDFRSYRTGQCGWLGRSDCLSSFIIKARK